MNQPEDILNLTNFENLPDYTIFKKKTPSLKRYPSSARKTLNRWYISFVKNNNPLIKYKYWISVNGYLENNNLIQSSPILNIEGPLVVLTANTKYFLVGNSDILKNPPHSRFDLTELSKFSNGFPFDWKEIIGEQLIDIFGACRLKNTTIGNDNLLSPFDKVYKELFGNEETNQEDNKVLKYNLNILDDNLEFTKQTKSYENENNINQNLNYNNEDFLLDSKFDHDNEAFLMDQNKNTSLSFKKLKEKEISLNEHEVFTNKKDSSFMQDLKKNDSRVAKGDSSFMQDSKKNDLIKNDSSFMQDSSIRSQMTKDSIKNDSSFMQDSSIRSQITKATLNSQTKNKEDFNNSKSSEEVEIISKSLKDDSPSNIFLEDNINKIFNIPEKKSSSNFTDNEILSISSKLLEKEGKSFENVMSVINKQKKNKNKNEIKKGKGDISELFINSSFNVQGNYTENNKTDKFHEEDYLQDSKIIESIFNLGNVIENSSFIPNESDKVNLSILSRRKKGENYNKKKVKDNKLEIKQSGLDKNANKFLSGDKSINSLLKENKSQIEEKSNKSLLEEFMNSRVRKPYSYEETNNLKIKKKKVNKEHSNSSLNKEHSNTSIYKEHSNTSLNKEDNNSSLNREHSDTILNKEHSDTILNKEHINSSLNREHINIIKNDSIKNRNEQINFMKIEKEESDIQKEENNIQKEVSDIQKEVSDIQKEENISLDQTLENFSNLTTVSQKNSNTPKKKKKSRSSLCMPRKSLQKKKPESKN